MTVHRTAQAAPTVSIVVPYGIGRYWFPVTDRGWWLDGDMYVSNVGQVDALIEALEAIREEIETGNAYNPNRPSGTPEANLFQYRRESYIG